MGQLWTKTACGFLQHARVTIDHRSTFPHTHHPTHQQILGPALNHLVPAPSLSSETFLPPTLCPSALPQLQSVLCRNKRDIGNT